MRSKLLATLSLTAAVALALSGCSGSGDSSGKTVIEWWHIQTVDPTKSVWQDLANEFEAEHPGVEIDITVQDGQPFKTALDARLQAGDPPDIFQTWGAGVLSNQVSAGLVKDITSDTSGWIDTLKPGPVATLQVDGKQYGIPYDAGLVGFWYNKALFAQAGITEAPATWPEFLDDVAALRDAGIVPIAVGAGDKWPAMFYWASLALAEGGQDAMVAAGEDGSFDAEPFVQAGEGIKQLLDLDAFQEGFLGAAYNDATGQASQVANGKAAMELMGAWAPGTEASVAENGVGLGDDLGWFAFPEVPGGAGGATEAFGGINGFAVGADAPPEAVEFLQFISSVDSQRKIGEAGLLLPVAVGAEDSVSNPDLQAILEKLNDTTFVQNFLDQAYEPAVANAINDNVQQIFAGTMTPQQAADAIAAVARG